MEGDGTRPECTQDDGDGASHVFAELGAGDFPGMRELGDGDLPALTVEEGLGPYNGGGGLEGLGDGEEASGGFSTKATHPSSACE